MSLAYQQPTVHRTLPYSPHYHGGNSGQYPMDRGSDYIKSEYNQPGLHQQQQQQYQSYPGSGPEASSGVVSHYPPSHEVRGVQPYGNPIQPRGFQEIMQQQARPFPEGQGPRYHPDNPTAGPSMGQPVNNAALPPLQHLHRPPESEGTDDGSSIAAPSPQYPPQPPYSPYPPQSHDMQPNYGHQNPGWRPQPGWPGPYDQQQHLQGPYGSTQSSPSTSVSTASSASAATARPMDKARRKQSRDSMPTTPHHPLSQVYSFVPIPGAAQHKRPRRRYEEIERMYKCGWNGCEKAYGTLNHLNAHVTMQSHGNKRTPEEFKEIRKEWKARKKEEEMARKQAEDDQARRDGYIPAGERAGPHVGYQMPPRNQLPPISYQQGAAPAHYPPPPSGMDPLQHDAQQMYNQYPPGPYYQGHPQGYQQRPSNQEHDGEADIDPDSSANYQS